MRKHETVRERHEKAKTETVRERHAKAMGIIFVAIVPHGWARDRDPKKALRLARRYGTRREPHVIYKVTGDDQPIVDNMGRLLATPNATAEIIEDTRGERG